MEKYIEYGKRAYGLQNEWLIHYTTAAPLERDRVLHG